MIAPTAALSTAAARTALTAAASTAPAGRIAHEAVIDQHPAGSAPTAGRPAGVRWIMPILNLTGLSVLVTNSDKAALALAAPQGRLARRAPAVDPQRVETINAHYLWNLLARSLSPAAAHRCIEVRHARDVYFMALGDAMRRSHYEAIVDMELLAAAVVAKQPAEMVRMPAYRRQVAGF